MKKTASFLLLEKSHFYIPGTCLAFCKFGYNGMRKDP